MPKVMFTITATGSECPDLNAIKQAYGLLDVEVDADFGVVPIDLDQHLFVVLIEAAAAGRISGGDWQAKGPFSNPQIADFGPPK